MPIFYYSKKHVIFYIRNIRQIGFVVLNVYCLQRERSIYPLKNKIGRNLNMENFVSDIALETVKKLLAKDKNKEGLCVCGGYRLWWWQIS